MPSFVLGFCIFTMSVRIFSIGQSLFAIAAMLAVALVASHAGAQEKRDLRAGFKSGYTYTFVQEQKAVLVAPGGQNMGINSELKLSAVVVDRNTGEEGVRVTTAVESVKFAMENPLTGVLSYDSTNPVDENSALAVQFEPILKNELVIIYDGDGKVVKVEGMDELAEAGGLGGAPISRDQIAQMADPTSMLKIDGDKMIGDKWSATPVVDMEMGTVEMPMELHYSKDEVTEDGHECARIDTVGTARMNLKIPGAVAGGDGAGITTKNLLSKATT